MSSTEDTFKGILADFSKGLTTKELLDFRSVTIKDVRKTILRIQENQEQTMTMMNVTRVGSFLEAMNQFSKVMEGFLNASDFLGFIWGSMDFIMQVRPRNRQNAHLSQLCSHVLPQ
jgi:hypothetical protein